MLVAYRDADPESVAELAGGELPPAQAQTVGNYWPIVGAFGAGVVVIGAVLLDIYRNKKATEVRVLTPADEYRLSMIAKIEGLKAEGAASSEIAGLKREMKQNFSEMKAEEKANLARLHAEERAAEKEFHQLLKQQEHNE